MTLKGAEVVIENWHQHYNHRMPHRFLNGRPPVPLTVFTPPQRGEMGPISPLPELSAKQAAETEPQRIYH